MTSPQMGPAQLATLQQILQLTPEQVGDELDLETLRQLIQRRQKLLDQLPPLQRGWSADEQGELGHQCRAIVAEILRRDQRIIARLEKARQTVGRLLQQQRHPKQQSYLLRKAI